MYPGDEAQAIDSVGLTIAASDNVDPTSLLRTAFEIVCHNAGFKYR